MTDHGDSSDTSSRYQNALPHLPDEPSFEDDAGHYIQRRGSTSTLGSTRRTSYYDNQRIIRRSPRPPSVASQATVTTSRSRSKRRSYQQPSAYGNLDEEAMPPPTEASEFPPFSLEDERYRDQGGPGPSTAANFSRPYQRRATSASNAREIGLSELSALPPVPKSQRSSKRMSAPAGLGDRRSQQIPEDPEREVDSERSEVDPAYSSRHPDELISSSPVPLWLTNLYTISYLIFFAIFGTSARLGLQWLTFYPGAPLTTPVVWANATGSLIMGFLSEDQALFSDHPSVKSEKGGNIDRAALAKHKKTIPLYIGLAVGLCGCFTSFSSFERDVFLALSNNAPSPIYHTFTSPNGVISPSSTVHRNGGYSFEALLAVILYTIALSLGGLFMGAHLAIFTAGFTPSLSRNFIPKIIDPLFVFLGWGCWLGALFLAIFPPSGYESWRGEVLFALVFAPLGCLLRFYVSLKLNGLVPSFPLGTFCVNMFGTAVEGMCYDIQHVGVGYMGLIGGGVVGCQVLQGIQDGFCGCLTTVSTWVLEIDGLRRRHGYFYAFTTVLCGLCLMIVIMGSVRWTVGFSASACDTGYPSKVHG